MNYLNLQQVTKELFIFLNASSKINTAIENKVLAQASIHITVLDLAKICYQGSISAVNKAFMNKKIWALSSDLLNFVITSKIDISVDPKWMFGEFQCFSVSVVAFSLKQKFTQNDTSFDGQPLSGGSDGTWWKPEHTRAPNCLNVC